MAESIQQTFSTLLTEHFLVLVYDPDKNPIPVLSDKENWLYLYHDTEYPDMAFSHSTPTRRDSQTKQRCHLC